MSALWVRGMVLEFEWSFGLSAEMARAIKPLDLWIHWLIRRRRFIGFLKLVLNFDFFIALNYVPKISRKLRHEINWQEQFIKDHLMHSIQED